MLVIKKLLFFVFLTVAFSQPDQVISGYLKQVEYSFCTDECDENYMQTFGDMYWPVIFINSIDNIHLYIDRYEDIWIGQEINCIECSAFEIELILISNECILSRIII